MAIKNKKVALVLSGGGMHGAFQVGALKALRDNWRDINTKWKGVDPNVPMKFDIVAGVSAGALNGVLTAADRLDDLDRLWTEVGNNKEIIYTSDFIHTKDQGHKVKIKVNLLKLIPLLFRGPRKRFKSIADNSNLKTTLIQQGVKINMIPPDTVYRCGYVSLDTGNYHSVPNTDFVSDEDFINGIVASTSIPIVWKPSGIIRTKSENPPIQKNCVDGGIRNSSPLGDVIKLINQDNDSEYLIIVINNHNEKMLREDYDDKNIAQIALRSVFDIALSEIFMNDLAEFLDINCIMAQVEKVAPGTVIKISGQEVKRFESIVIQPDDPNIMGDALAANPKLIQQRKDYGAEIALQELGKYQVGNVCPEVDPV